MTSGDVQPTLREVMVSRLGDADRRLRLSRDKTSIWIVCGVNGTGKTTSIAKLAARAKSLGIKTCLAAADTFRAAAVEQIEEWGRRVDVPVIRQDAGADPGDFFQTNTCIPSVGTGNSCGITVTFKPTVKGSRFANVSITDDSAGSPQLVWA